MSKILLFASLSIFISACILVSCIETPKEQNDNRVYFEINPENRQIILPVQLNDSISANLWFDTGGQFVLDAAFFTAHPSLVPNSEPVIDPKFGSAWSFYRDSAWVYYDDIPKMKLGKFELEEFSRMTAFSWKQHYNTEDSDGMFNIPANDTTNVWEFNFDLNYVEIHTENFEMPENSFVTPLLPNYYVQLPLKVRFADGDTINLNHHFFVDLGMPYDIVLMHRAEELEFFNRKEDAVWTETSSPGGYHRHYTVDAVLFDDFPLDSVRIYTFDHPNDISANYLVGLNFLKRFNLFFDMNNREVGLQPIENYQRVVNPNHRRFHFSTYLTPDGRWKVRKVADYPGNYYREAGIKEEDVLITVNDIPMKDIMNKGNPEIIYDTLIFDILRGGEPLKIVVPIDKNEVQGD